MPFTDTHCHLDFPDYRYDLEPVIHRALQFNVRRLISIGTSLESSRRVVDLARLHPQVYATVGIHPCDAGNAPADFIDHLRPLAREARVVALGECGLDYHHAPERAEGLDDAGYEEILCSWKAAQKAVFRAQLDLAVECGLPVVIHQRQSWEDVMECLRPYQGRLRAVFHCFGESPERVQEVVEAGHFLSFTGILTFKNADTVRQAAAAAPADRFMLETDAPYLAPVPFRGQRNEPAYVPLIAETLAETLATSVDEIASQTEANTDAFFRFPEKD